MKLYPSIPDKIAEWAQKQPVFFTGSAPSYGTHVNVSPKGLTDSHFAILSPNQVAYIDRTGSGCETIAHAYDNGRLCIMFMSFGPTPRIVRFFCRARIVEWDEAEFPDLVRRIAKGKREAFDGARAVVIADVFEAQTSCGYGVPLVKKEIYAPEEEGDKEKRSLEEVLQEGVHDRLSELCVFEERKTMDKWVKERVEANTLQKYHNETNVESMDGLPGLKAARRGVGERLWFADTKSRARRALAHGESIVLGFFLAVVLYLVLTIMGVKF